VTKRGWVLLCLVALVIVLAVAGCGPDSAKVEAKQKEQCFANERLLKTAMDAFYADSGMYPPLSTVTSKLDVKCPAGGEYTFDEKSDAVSCSVHGHP
jgi:hypothetical protein